MFSLNARAERPGRHPFAKICLALFVLLILAQPGWAGEEADPDRRHAIEEDHGDAGAGQKQAEIEQRRLALKFRQASLVDEIGFANRRRLAPSKFLK